MDVISRSVARRVRVLCSRPRRQRPGNVVRLMAISQGVATRVRLLCSRPPSQRLGSAEPGARDNGEPMAALLPRALRVDHPCSPAMLVLRLLPPRQAVQKLGEPSVQEVVQRNCSSPPFLVRLQVRFQVRVVPHECVDVRDFEHALRPAPPQSCFSAPDCGEACVLWQRGSQPSLGFCKRRVAQADDGICCDVAASVCGLVAAEVCARVQAHRSADGRHATTH